MNLIKNEDGAALLSVLLLVAVMSAAMVASFDLLGFYTKNSFAKQQKFQAHEYALAGELIGAEQANKLSKINNLSPLIDASTVESTVTFQIPDGTVSGSITEVSNCFNLTSLVQGTNASTYEINQIHYDQFIRLLNGLGIGSRQSIALSSALVDWQDSDGRSMPMGSEDYYYSQQKLPYRAANTPIVELNELRLINGYTAELISALKPITCVDAQNMKTVLNLNSLNKGHANLVHALLGLPISIQDVGSIIEGRPPQGYDHVARFWNHAFLKDKEINQAIRSQFDINPKRYNLLVDVQLSHARVHLESLISLNDDGSYNLISRKFGA